MKAKIAKLEEQLNEAESQRVMAIGNTVRERLAVHHCNKIRTWIKALEWVTQ